MAGLLTNANYINNTIKPAIKSAIEAQGVTVPSTDSFLDYADRIGEIEGGGSGYQLKDLPTGSISTVNDAAPLPLNALKVSVEAVQDLHGYDHPWVGGAGKNILPMGIINEEVNDVVYTKISDIDGNALGFSMVGLCSETISRIIATISIKAGTYILNGCNGGAYNSYALRIRDENDTGNAVWQGDGDAQITFASDTTALVQVFVWQGANVNQIIYPMLRKSGTSADFEPYSNICPIEGWDSGEITVCDDIQSPTQTETYTQQFPTTIYGAEWDVVNGQMKVTDGYIASYNGESLPSTWISDRDVYASGTTPTTGAEVVYKLATPTTIDLSPLSIRMLEGTNNVYADCGEVIEGEYFVDEGAIDVRKVDYQIGASGSIKTTDGRVLSGFASMNGYHARPLDASGNWLDVDWSKDWEIGSAFKASSLSGNTTIFGCGVSGSMNYAPNLYFYQGATAYVTLSEDGSSSAVDTALNYAFQTDTWYFVRAKFTKSTLNLKIEVSTDMSNFTTAYNDTLAAAPYHDAASISIGGMAQSGNYSSDSILIDIYNTYIKDDSGSIVWGASTGAFPS